MTVTSKLANQKRSAWKPVVEEGDGPLAGSKFSGTALVPAGEDWPRCPNCERPMQLFIQLAAADLPAEAPRFGDGVLQLFYCASSEPLCEVDCEAFAPFSKSVLARVVDPANAVEPSSRPDEPFPPRRIVGWERIDDYPSWSEVSEDVELSDAEYEELGATYPGSGDKLGGWPAWQQDEEYPECTECDQPMRYLLQIDSDDNLPYQFGDIGTGHLAQCSDHPHILSFHWACG